MPPTTHPTPRRLFVVTALSLFIGEVAVMLLLVFLPALPVLVEAAFDALLLTTLATPVLFFCLLRPMTTHIRERTKAEAELRKAKDGLETRVAERTSELAAAVESLEREVEQRTRAQEELARTNEFTRTVVESAPFLLLVYDADQKHCVYANSWLESLLGYTPEEACMQGKVFFQTILGPADYQSFVERNWTLSRGEPTGPATQALHLRHTSGELRRCEVTTVVLSKTESGVPREVLLVAMECEGGAAGRPSDSTQESGST